MDANERKPLIAEKFCKPLMLLWTIVLPQSVLLLVNISSWQLIKGEVSIAQKQMLLQIFVFELVLLLSGLSFSILLTSLKKSINLIICALLFLAHIGYLWLVTGWLDRLLPDSVTIWILTPDQVIYYQYILMMPAVFYTGLRLSCFTPPVKLVTDIAVTVAILIAVPVGSYLFTTIIFSSFMYSLDIPDVIMITIFVGATIITMMAFLRTITYIYIWLNRYQTGHIVLLFVVGLAAPLGGLALNSQIPFPCDFQSTYVYILAAINGLILLACFKERTKIGAFGWFLRCLMYPFSLYFFLVFLPFLPLSLLAMTAMGSGVLILAPTALFIVHTRKLLDEGRYVVNNFGRTTALVLFAIGVSILPAFITIGALLDRHSLTQAMDAVYSPDYANAGIQVKPKSVQRSLLKLRDMKNGIFLPFISSFYNKVVFNGMVLPDHKMNDMYQMFFGQEMPQRDFSGGFGFGNRMNFRNAPVSLPKRNVALTDVEITETPDGPFTRADIQLTLINDGNPQSEFVTNIQLDPGVMVSDYWLKIGEEKVSGHIFEKKAAMWIYHMIRDVTRRDPGLLIYKTDRTLKLSVYPFREYQTRLTGIELLYPAGMNPSVNIGDKQLELNSNTIPASEKVLFVQTDATHAAAILSNKTLKTLPVTQRTPYLHFILDCSVNAKEAFGSFCKQMIEIANGCSGIRQCKITLANYESKDITSDLTDIEDIEKKMQNAAAEIDFQGGFCGDRAIKQKLLSFHSAVKESPDDLLSVPIFVVLKAEKSQSISIGEMAPFGQIAPDIASYYIAKEEGKFISKTFDGKESIVSNIQLPFPAVLLKCGESFSVCPSEATCCLATFSDTSNQTLEVYDPETKRFTIVNNLQSLEGDSAYAKGLAVWDKYRQTVYHPNQTTDAIAEIVRMSKDCGIIVPSTSYIVLENSAQMEMLKRKEKQGLSANQALEFDEFIESPAPPTLLLAPVVILLMYKLRRRKNVA